MSTFNAHDMYSSGLLLPVNLGMVNFSLPYRCSSLCWGRDDDALNMEDCHPKVALGVEDSHCLVALGELVVLVDLDEELVDAHVLRKSFLELRREVLLDVVELVGLDWLRHDLNLEGHVAPQVLELHVVVVLDVAPRRLGHLDVVALAPLVLVDVGVAVLVLVRKQLGCDDVDALESRCRVEDCG